MKNETIVWQKIATIALLATAFIASLVFTSCEDSQPRIPSIADEIVHYSGNYEIINDSIAVLKDGKANRDFIYKKNVLNSRWRRVM